MKISMPIFAPVPEACFATLLAWVGLAGTAHAAARTITWLYPTADGRYEVDSAIDDATVNVVVTTADGEVVDTSASLQAAGLETPKLAAEAEEFAPYGTPGNELVRAFSDYVRGPDRLDAAKLQLGAYIESARQALRQAGRSEAGHK